MKEIRRPFIIYQSPKSAKSQSILTPRIEKAWDKVRTFLNLCTYYEKPEDFTLTAYEAWKNEDPEPPIKIIRKMETIFGKTERKPQGYMFPSGEEVPEGYYEWTFKSEMFTKALEFMIENQPWPKYVLGPVNLVITYDFYWIDPVTRDILLDQGNHKSYMILCLNRNSSCDITGLFPFLNPNEKFWDYINKIKSYFPCKFNERYLRMGIPNKNGLDYHYRKLDRYLE